MALKKTGSAAFEDVDTNDTVETGAQAETQETVAEQVASATETVATETVASSASEVAVKPSGGLALKGVKLSNPFRELENQIDIETVKSFGAGTFPKLVADRAGVMKGSDELGKHIKVNVLSFNNRWVVSPGVDDDEAKNLVKTSYDGINVEGEGTVEAYLERLKDEGYEKASCRKYVDLWATLVETENEGVIPDEAQEMVHIQLSPQSVGQWNAFQVNQGLLASRGIQPSSLVKVTQENGEFNNKKFGYFKFSKG